KARVAEQAIVGNSKAVREARGAQTDQTGQVFRYPIKALPFIDYAESILLPRPVKQGNEAVVEEIQKIRHGVIAFADSGQEKSRVAARKHAGRTGLAHERDTHGGHVVIPVDLADVVRWKR